MPHFSKISLALCLVFILGGLSYLPRWKKKNAHATISYDVSGYYIYLPAIFIYKDIKKMAFKDKIHEKYKNSSHSYETSSLPNGNVVTQYSIGQSVSFLPFFLIADFLATPLGYERDGYSLPYQAGVHWGSVLIAFLGLYYLRKNLLEYFSDKVTAATILLIVLATNYFNYVTMDAAMSHNYLFTLTSLLIWNTIQFYKNPNLKRSCFIGLIIGLAALTRPTEIVLAFIPLFWGLTLSIPKIKERYSFLKEQRVKIIAAILITSAIGSIQLMYWKYVGDSWLIYSYGENGFDWFHPHVKNGTISFRKGWLVYTPIMFFSLIGLARMILKKQSLGLYIFFHFMIVFYLTFAWSCWWYGGSLGQRALVQSYAILAFPFAYFLQWSSKKKIRWIPVTLLSLFFIYYNVWLHHQAHRGNMLDAENMSPKYFKKIFLKWEKNKDDLKYLDHDEEFIGERKNINRIYFNDFEKDTTIQNSGIENINGNNGYHIPIKTDLNGFFSVPFTNNNAKWLRVGGTFKNIHKEWNVWNMTQIILRFKNKDQVVKFKLIRINRILDDFETRTIFMDSEIPHEKLTDIEIVFWSGLAQYPILVDDLYMEVFQ